MTRDYCAVAEARCVNPPGYGISGGGSASNPDGGRISVTCRSCGDTCCAECRLKHGGEWWCTMCLERVARDRGVNLASYFDWDAFIDKLKEVLGASR